MKISAEIMKLAIEIQSRLDLQRQYLKKIDKKNGWETTEPKITRIDVKLDYHRDGSAIVMGKAVRTYNTHLISIRNT